MSYASVAPRKLREDFIFRTESEMNEYPGKRGMKKRLGQIKKSIKARKQMSTDEYKGLLADRGRRLQVIKILFPILSDREVILDFGFSEQGISNSFDDLHSDETLPKAVSQSLETHDVLVKAVHEQKLSRAEFRKHMSRMLPLELSPLEKNELLIDFLIWRIYPFIEFLATYRLGMTEEEAYALSANPSLAKEIEYAVKNRLITRYPSDPDHPYGWSLHRKDADRMKVAFPNIAGAIEMGVL